MSDMREQFENWVSAPPREFDVERFDEDHDSWPGGYRSYKVQCAWEAWQAAQEEGLVADLKRQLAARQAFKDFVHQKLDAMGVATHPHGEHSKKGCRIGDRLDLIELERADLKHQLNLKECALMGSQDRVKELEGHLEEARKKPDYKAWGESLRKGWADFKKQMDAAITSTKPKSEPGEADRK